MTSRTAARVVLLTGSMAVALVCGEVGTRVFGMSKTWNSYSAEPELNLGDLVTPEPIGFTRRPSTSWKMPRGFTFSSNAAGFRDQPFSIARDPALTRVAFLGDSVTEGYGLNPAERFSNLAIQSLNSRGGARYEGLNFGVVGQSTADEYVVLTKHALAYKPDIVVLQIGWNDFAENAHKLPVIQGVPVPKPVTAFAPPPPPAGGGKAFLQRHSALYLALAERLSVLRLKRGGPNPLLARIRATSPEEWTATETLLTMFVSRCREAGAIPVLVYFPMDVEALTSDPGAARFVADRLQVTIDRVGATRVDLLGALQRHRDESLYLDDVHLTPAGSAVVAAELAAAIGAIKREPVR